MKGYKLHIVSLNSLCYNENHTKIFIKGVFRMILIDYCGYHTHNSDQDLIFRPSGTKSYLFLLVLSPMIFHFTNQSCIQAKSGACILYSPGTCQYYQAEKEFFNSYVHFFCKEEQMKTYQIRLNELFYPKNSEELNWLIKKIYQEHLNGFDSSKEMLDLYIRQLLILIRRAQIQQSIPNKQNQDLYSEFFSVRAHILSNCEQLWTIEQMCQMLSIGKSQFYKYYKHFFHSTPKEEIIQARLQKAKYLMTNEAVTIQQAAYKSGFPNIWHFNRLFKNQYNCTPSQYRKKLIP